jgi:predicted Zn-dependent protease
MRRWSLSILGLLLSTPCFAQAPSPADLRQAVYTLLRAHRFPEAETAARKAKETSPNDCVLDTFLGLALRGEGKLEAALVAFQQSLHACPEDRTALAGAAEIAYGKNLPETSDLLRRLLAAQPGNGTARAMLAATEAREGDCETAVRDYGAVASQIAGNASATRQYAGCLVALGRPQEAVDLLLPLREAQNTAQNRLALARAQNSAEKRADALATLAPDTGADAKDPTALLLAAQIAEADNKTPQAVPWLRQAIALDPKRIEPYLYFAEISFNHGSYQVGLDLLNVGLRQNPNNARLLLARGVLEVQMTRMEAALADFEAAHTIDPKLALAEDAIGVLFSQKHDLHAALALFDEKRKAQPNDPMVQYLYAEALSEGEPEEASLVQAIAAAKRALELEPAYQPARDLLCVLLMRHADYQGVVDASREAIRRDPFDETAIYQALLAQRKLKHTEQVEALVQQLQSAKSHNQMAITKYALQEPGQPGTQPQSNPDH